MIKYIKTYLKGRQLEIMGDRLICGCVRVYQSDIEKAIENGARTFNDIQRMTKAGTSCGNCRPLVDKILRNKLSEIDD